MDITDVLTVIGGFIAVLLAIGAGLALVRGSYNKARIEALRGDNSDLRDRVKDLEQTVERHETKEQALEARCEHLEQENITLLEGITQRADVEALKSKLDSHHTQAMEKFDRMIQLLEAGAA